MAEQQPGLIAGQQQASAQGEQELTPQAVSGQMKLPPELQEAYERVVLAGMKMMFGKDTNAQMLKQLQSLSGPISERLGTGIAGILAELFRMSNKTMPPQVIIPAGVELLMQAADFLKRSGAEQIDNKAIGDAMDVMVTTVLKMFKLDPGKVVQFADQQAGQQQSQPAAQPQPQGA